MKKIALISVSFFLMIFVAEAKNYLLDLEVKIKSSQGITSIKKRIKFDFNKTYSISRKDLNMFFEIKGQRIGIESEHWQRDLAEFQMTVKDAKIETQKVSKMISPLGEKMDWNFSDNGKEYFIKIEASPKR